MITRAGCIFMLTVDPATVPRSRFWEGTTRPLVFHCLRRFPDWAGWLPAHTPKMALAKPPTADSAGSMLQ